jgi:hypothetical protein
MGGYSLVDQEIGFKDWIQAAQDGVQWRYRCAYPLGS